MTDSSRLVAGAILFSSSMTLTLLWTRTKSSCHNLSTRKPWAGCYKTVNISKLWVYPVKSCRGISVNAAKVTKRGFEWDRMFMVVNQAGKFISQRTHPKMALVETRLNIERGVLELHAPEMPSCFVLLDFEASCRSPDGGPSTAPLTVLTCTVWGDEVTAVEVMGTTVSSWFQTFLNDPTVRFVRMHPECLRRTDPKYDLPAIGGKGQTSLSDGYPFLLSSEASLLSANQELVRQGQQPIGWDRFRANIVVDGCEPFEEDRWGQLRFEGEGRVHPNPPKEPLLRCSTDGSSNNCSDTSSSTVSSTSSSTNVVSSSGGASGNTVDMWNVKPCSRCTIPNVDQTTGQVHPQRQPSKTLEKIHSGEAMGISGNPKWNKMLMFGVNLDHAAQEGAIISVGDTVRVLSAQDKFFH